MKRNLLLLAVVVFAVFVLSNLSLAVCPQAPNDNGNCDTLFMEVWSEDTILLAPGPFLVRVPLYVYHDIISPATDSIAAFVIPLCFLHTNPSRYCSLSPFNNTGSLTVLEPNRSVFRDIDGVENWMLDLYQEDPILAWDSRSINVTGGDHFWFSLVSSGEADRRYGENNLKRLLATMTFKLEDSMIICIDSCFWPPGPYGVTFARSDARTFIPRLSWVGATGDQDYCFKTTLSLRGDVNGDGLIDVGDVVYVINYLFKAGDPPIPLKLGDADCDGLVDINDVVYLINYLFKHGPAPACE
jgi:hypothetical protein